MESREKREFVRECLTPPPLPKLEEKIKQEHSNEDSKDIDLDHSNGRAMTKKRKGRRSYSPNKIRELRKMHKHYVDGVASGIYMTRDERIRYMLQINISEGFDVEDFKHIREFGLIIPFPVGEEDEKKYAEAAIKLYNEENNSKFVAERILKANAGGCLLSKLWVTLEARDTDGVCKEFQAVLHIPVAGDMFVEFCRAKPEDIKDWRVAYGEIMKEFEEEESKRGKDIWMM